MGNNSMSGKSAGNTASPSQSNASTRLQAVIGTGPVGVLGSRLFRLTSSRAAALATALQVVSSAGMEMTVAIGWAGNRLVVAGTIALQEICM